jgi:ATP-dependent DNA helicase UvrD/PcrA
MLKQFNKFPPKVPESSIIKVRPKLNYSEYQKAIFREINSGTQNLIVVARAGSAKTSSLVEGSRYIPRGQSSIFVCFNKSIQLALKDQLPSYCFAQTLHSLGLAAVKSRFGNVEVDNNKCFKIVSKIVDDEKQYDLIINIVKAVGLCKARLVDTPDKIEELIAEYDIELCETEPGLFIKYITQTLRQCKLQNDVVDFSDMIWFPFVYHISSPKSSIVFIDETQDLTRSQLELALSAVKPDGRVIAVLDDRQVLYSFAGVDLNVLDYLRKRLNAKELTLPICYRCPRSVVKLAQEYVPDILPYENAIEGKIHYIHTNDLYDKVSAGCFVLSRINAPLISICMKMLRQGIKANIFGRDVGDGLQYLIKKSKKKTVPKFLEWLVKWEKSEKERILAKNPKSNTEFLTDKIECLYNLCEGTSSLEEVKANIDKMFKDVEDKDVVWLSSIHKRKGGEADIVFILKDTLRYGNVSEENINYVSLSRTKKELYFVSKSNTPLED